MSVEESKKHFLINQIAVTGALSDTDIDLLQKDLAANIIMDVKTLQNIIEKYNNYDHEKDKGYWIK